MVFYRVVMNSQLPKYPCRSLWTKANGFKTEPLLLLFSLRESSVYFRAHHLKRFLVIKFNYHRKWTFRFRRTQIFCADILHALCVSFSAEFRVVVEEELCSDVDSIIDGAYEVSEGNIRIWNYAL